MAYINEERIMRFGAPEMTKNKATQLQITCVINCPSNIRFIDSPSEEVQLAAVNADPFTIRYIKYPTRKVKERANVLISKMRRR